jgi:DNA-binding response OmpR family regulator
MLTAKDRMEDKIAGLDAGGDDYLVKPFGMGELLARLRALQRRSPQLEPEQLQIGSLILECETLNVYYLQKSGTKQIVALANKEFQILEYLMKHPNQILTSDRLRHQIWDLSADSFSNVVAAQVRLLRRKLQSIGCFGLIETVHGMGYRLVK